MRISTIIPAYNSERTLRRAVESLLETNDPDLEIVIVEDGSKDGTLEVAEQLQREHPEMVRVTTHPGRVNRRLPATRNRGIEFCTGEWIALLDADDYVYPHRFHSAREILSTQPDVDGVYQLCAMEFSDEQAREAWWDSKPTFGFETAIPPQQLIFELLRAYCWATSAIVFRRSLLEKSGMFDADRLLTEDCHLWFRMAMVGTLVAGDLSKPISVYWRHGDSQYQPSPKMRVHMIYAMTSFWHWLKKSKPNDPRIPAITRQIAEYILNGIAVSRSNGERSIAWQMAMESAYQFLPLVTYRRWYGHVGRMALGR